MFKFRIKLFQHVSKIVKQIIMEIVILTIRFATFNSIYNIHTYLKMKGGG